MPGPEECFESKQALNARFRESNRNISPIEKDYHTNLKECKNDILFIAYVPVVQGAGKGTKRRVSDRLPSGIRGDGRERGRILAS